jgi:hypothetical protein
MTPVPILFGASIARVILAGCESADDRGCLLLLGSEIAEMAPSPSGGRQVRSIKRLAIAVCAHPSISGVVFLQLRQVRQ